MKTMAELEAEFPEDFRNPEISDEEFAKIRAESAAKAVKEMLTCPLDDGSEDDEETEEEE